MPSLRNFRPIALEELADLGRPAPDAGDPLDLGGGLGGRAGRVVAEVVLQRLAVLVQFALGARPVGPLEPLDAAVLELPQVAAEGVLGDAGQAADVLVGQPLALEVDGLHLQLHPGMGVMEPFVVQGVDLLGREVDVDHRRRPSGTSWRTESGDELTTRVTPGQPSTFSREEYK